MMEDTLDRGALTLGTCWGAEFEHDDRTSAGVEDKQIVWIAAVRHSRFEGSHSAFETHALAVIGDWVERK